MKLLLTIAVILCGLGSVHADVSDDHVHAKHVTCEELQDIVQEAGSILVVGLGSLVVHSTDDQCHPLTHDVDTSYWMTRDTGLCFAGYRCVLKNDGDR